MTDPAALPDSSAFGSASASGYPYRCLRPEVRGDEQLTHDLSNDLAAAIDLNDLGMVERLCRHPLLVRYERSHLDRLNDAMLSEDYGEEVALRRWRLLTQAWPHAVDNDMWPLLVNAFEGNGTVQIAQELIDRHKQTESLEDVESTLLRLAEFAQDAHGELRARELQLVQARIAARNAAEVAAMDSAAADADGTTGAAAAVGPAAAIPVSSSDSGSGAVFSDSAASSRPS